MKDPIIDRRFPLLHAFDRWRQGDYDEVRYLYEFRRTQFLPSDELQALRWERLKKTLQLAYQKIPYYKESFDAASVHPEDIKTEEDLLRVPILEKRQLQTNYDRLLVPNYPPNKLLKDRTGGSTGTPVHYAYGLDRKHYRQAGAMRHDEWAGRFVEQRKAALWGAARDMQPAGWKQKLKACFFPKYLTLNTVNMTPEIMLDFNEQLKRWQPPTILAYANALVLFCKTLKQRGVQAYQPQGIITSAEVLTADDRKFVEEVMGAKVFNRLGCREFSVIASECGEHNGMHIMAEGLYIEIVKNGKHCAEGELGEILVTDILNDAMPLIRYRIGDTAEWAKGGSGTCACGRSLPRIDNVAGRVTGFVVGMDGGFCSGVALATFIVSTMPSLGQIQIVQDEKDKILYRVGCGRDKRLSDSDFALLREKTELYLGKGIGIDYEFVDSIPHEASGKFLFSKSKVAEEMMR